MINMLACFFPYSIFYDTFEEFDDSIYSVMTNLDVI